MLLGRDLRHLTEILTDRLEDAVELRHFDVTRVTPVVERHRRPRHLAVHKLEDGLLNVDRTAEHRQLRLHIRKHVPGKTGAQPGVADPLELRRLLLLGLVLQLQHIALLKLLRRPSPHLGEVQKGVEISGQHRQPSLLSSTPNRKAKDKAEQGESVHAWGLNPVRRQDVNHFATTAGASAASSFCSGLG